MSVFINGKALACVTSTCYLGVIIHQKITYKLCFEEDYVASQMLAVCFEENQMQVTCFAPSEAIARSLILLSKLYIKLSILDYWEVVWVTTVVLLQNP